jgi:TetR/AcrR family transcriptional regulator, transcriptional repressor for nem operon
LELKYTNRYICIMEGELSKAERTRNFIIEATAAIFNTKGYAGTSMSDITEATGLTKGSIYGNFENKEEVALAVFDYNLNKVNSLIGQLIHEAPSFYDKLMAFIRVYNRFKDSDFPEGGCPVLNTAIEADDTHALLREKAAQAFGKWKKNIEELIKKGIQAGEFKKDTDPSQIALSILDLV